MPSFSNTLGLPDVGKQITTAKEIAEQNEQIR